MFSNDEIMEVMADEIGEFADARRNGFQVNRNEEVVAVSPHIFKRAQYSTNQRSWPESERYPSARYGQLLGETKVDRYAR